MNLWVTCFGPSGLCALFVIWRQWEKWGENLGFASTQHCLSWPTRLPLKISLVGLADLFSLRTWHRNLHIWSPNYAPTFALHKLRKWLRFDYAIATSVIRSSFLMRSYFWHGRCVQKGCGPAYDMRIKSCNSSAGFGANIGSEHIQKSLQLGENVRVEEASVWNLFRRRLSVSLQRLCCCD